jgi:regulator of sirC expression with transglutaminase-like and TPR domain
MRISNSLQSHLGGLIPRKDDHIDVMQAALGISSLLTPSKTPQAAIPHLDEISTALQACYETLLPTAPTALDAKYQALTETLVEHFGFHGDEDAFDDLDHLNVYTLLETRCGTPLSLCLLYFHLCSTVGWTVNLLNFPGFNLISLEEGPSRIILDPFQQAQKLDAYMLRQMIKMVGGSDVELNPSFYQPISPLTLAIRYAHTIKAHFMRCEQVEKAIELVETSICLDPQSDAFWREAGLLHARIYEWDEAIICLEKSRSLCPDILTKQHLENLIADFNRERHDK